MTPPVLVTGDIVYATSLQEEEVSWKLDVYAPDEAGNWPVVVFLHGLGVTKKFHIRDSQTIAERGVVVYAVNWPTWGTPSAGLTDESLRATFLRSQKPY